MEESENRRRVASWLGDGAYDAGTVYEMLETRGIEAVIKPRRNSRLDTASPARRREARHYLDLGYEAWARGKDYGRRWRTLAST